MAMTWEELVADVTARHPLKESKMFGMPCLKRENGKVVAGHWKDGGLTVKLTDDAQRDAALALPGAQLFDPGMGRVMREWVLVPEAQSDEWERLVEQAVSGVGSTEPPKSGGAGYAGAGAGNGVGSTEPPKSGGAGYAGAGAGSG